MVVVVLIELRVELQDRSASPGQDLEKNNYQVEYRHLHHTLIEVRGPVLDNLHSNNFLCFQVLALDNLPEGPLTQNI